MKRMNFKELTDHLMELGKTHECNVTLTYADLTQLQVFSLPQNAEVKPFNPKPRRRYHYVNIHPAPVKEKEE